VETALEIMGLGAIITSALSCIRRMLNLRVLKKSLAPLGERAKSSSEKSSQSSRHLSTAGASFRSEVN
jgi:hypothetical protein